RDSTDRSPTTSCSCRCCALLENDDVTNNVPTVRLSNGVEIPQLGFGVFKIPPDEVVEPVRQALEVGYRLIDTATLYDNEEGVGRAIATSDVPRDEIFLTTKVWNSEHGFDSTLRAFDASQKLLGL